jgi:hypothetical protein
MKKRRRANSTDAEIPVLKRSRSSTRPIHPNLTFGNLRSLCRLLSHAGKESLLLHALRKGKTSSSLLIDKLVVRGKLERGVSSALLVSMKHMPVVHQFYHVFNTLVLDQKDIDTNTVDTINTNTDTKTNTDVDSMQQVCAVANLLLDSTRVNPDNLPPPAAPARVLAGTIVDTASGQEFDIVLCRDRSSKMAGLSILLTEGNGHRKKGKKVGYLLAGVDKCGDVSLRGVHIAETARGRGLSKLLLSTWIILCHKLGVRPTTKIMDKPLVSLVLESSFGFVAENQGWPVHIGAPFKRSTADTTTASREESGCARLWSENNQRLRSLFSKNLCKTQRIEIVQECPSPSRRTYVHTIFHPPKNIKERVQELFNTVKHTLYSSKIIAFACEFSSISDVIAMQNAA